MSVDYVTIRPALIALIQTISGIDNVDNVVWEDQGQQYGVTQIRLKLKSPISIGADEVRHEEVGAVLASNYCGNRGMTLSVTCETSSQTDAGFALQYIENIRTRMRREASRLSLENAGMSIRDIQQPVEQPFTDGDHQWSKWILDIRLNTVANDLVVPASGGWIESTVIGSPFGPTDLIVTQESYSSGFSKGFAVGII